MSRALLFSLLLTLLCASPFAGASQEGVLPLGSFKVESAGIGESGPVIVSGQQSKTGFESLEVSAFGKTFALTKPQLTALQGGHLNSLQLSYERSYAELGGRTIYLRFSVGFTSGVAEGRLVTITERGSITVVPEKNP